jgi:5-methylcytosine-specific restriction endonuclease McrA
MPSKKKIPKALRDQVWLHWMGRVYEGKCKILWCRNIITVHNFQCGHNIPASKNGATTLDNLVPICNSCNGSMSNKYTISEWNKLVRRKKTWWWCCCSNQHVDNKSGKPHRDC